MKTFLFSFAIAATCLALHTTAHANLVINGSFEDVSPAPGVQTQASGTWSIYSAIAGWTTTAGPGIEVRNNAAGTASSGANYVELDSTGNTTMAQTLLTSLGSYYALSFDYSGRAGVAASSNGIEVLWNSTLINLTAINASGLGQSNHVWTGYTFGVYGTGSDVLSFRAVGTPDSLGGSLDNVRVVSEPGLLATLGLGLFALAWSRRKVG
jgi:PEP-CTERM motif